MIKARFLACFVGKVDNFLSTIYQQPYNLLRVATNYPAVFFFEVSRGILCMFSLNLNFSRFQKLMSSII